LFYKCNIFLSNKTARFLGQLYETAVVLAFPFPVNFRSILNLGKGSSRAGIILNKFKMVKIGLLFVLAFAATVSGQAQRFVRPWLKLS